MTEEEIKAAFISAYNKLITEKEEILTNAELIRKTICDTSELKKERQKLEDELNVAADMLQKVVDENARTIQNQDEYRKRYDSLYQRYGKVKEQLNKVESDISTKDTRSQRLADFTKMLKEQDGVIRDFDARLWGLMVDYVTVGRKKEMVFTFRDGTEIRA